LHESGFATEILWSDVEPGKGWITASLTSR
jgi:hypothetical protein